MFSQPENAQKCVGGPYSAPPDPLAGLRGPTSKGRGSERRGGERGKGGEGTGGKGEGMGGKCPPSEILKTPLSVAVSFHF